MFGRIPQDHVDSIGDFDNTLLAKELELCLRVNGLSVMRWPPSTTWRITFPMHGQDKKYYIGSGYRKSHKAEAKYIKNKIRDIHPELFL